MIDKQKLTDLINDTMDAVEASRVGAIWWRDAQDKPVTDALAFYTFLNTVAAVARGGIENHYLERNRG